MQRLRTALTCLLLAACWPSARGALGLPAQPPAQVPEFQLKAAVIFNFAVFAEWPPDVLAAGGPLQLCGNAGSALFDALAALGEKNVNGHRLQVRALGANVPPRSCHLLVLERQDRERWAQLRRELGNASVLTIADDRQIAASGAMLGLFMEDSRLVFDADLGALRACNLVLSSKLLRLARSAQ
jgi:hypothetical protein